MFGITKRTKSTAPATAYTGTAPELADFYPLEERLTHVPAIGAPVDAPAPARRRLNGISYAPAL